VTTLRTLLLVGAAGLGVLAASPAPTDQAVILNSGSTNAAGFQITVPRSGDLQFAPGSKKGRGGGDPPAAKSLSASADLVQRFFTDLDAAQPLHSLPASHCAKSASFGTRLTVQYQGETSPDLSCGGDDPKLKAVIQDAQEIVALTR
jgi:hypothetical protein